MSNLPATTYTRHTYPFKELSPDQFEEMVYLLIKRDSRFDPHSVEWIGCAGDMGRDITARRITSKRLWYTQAKRWLRFGPADAESVINEIAKNVIERKIEKPEAIIIAISCRPTEKTRIRAKQKAADNKIYMVEFWDKSELGEKISQEPLIRERFFDAGRGLSSFLNLDLGGFELPKISALYEDGTQIERLAPGVADAFPKLPDKLVDREKHLDEIQSKIDKRSKLLLWSRLPKSTKTILSVQLAKRYSQEQNIIYIKASTSSRMCRQIISHVERIRAETKATVSIPADLSYVFEDVLALLIELLKRYAKHVSIIIDDFNEIDSNELQSSLISLISSWPHLAIIAVDTITDRKRILSLTENVKNIEITGYSINDILQLLQFEKLPSAAHKKEYAEMIYALSSRGYPPLSHHMIRKVREAYSEKGTIGIFTPFLQKTTLPDDAALAVTRALKETLTGLDDKTILAVISLSLGSALPKRCITKALEKTFEIETAGESIQRLSNLWLDEDVKGRLSAPQALKLHSQSWLSESKNGKYIKYLLSNCAYFTKLKRTHRCTLKLMNGWTEFSIRFLHLMEKLQWKT